jgi:hypothetical protein
MAAYGIKKFGWVKQRSAYQDMVYHRARRAEFAKQDQANLEAMNNAMSTAMQNRISKLADIAAQAALKRVQAATKAKLDEATKQIDAAQSLVDQTSKSASSTSSTGSTSVLDTVA